MILKKSSLIIFLIAGLLSFESPAFSQSANNPVVLLQGKIIDSQSGNPVGTGIQFVNSEGKKLQTKSNPGSGAFTQVLRPNEDFIIMFKDYILVDDSKTFRTPNVSEYHEMNKDFHIKKIVTGMELFRFNAYDPNESHIEGTSIQKMKEVKEMLAYNPKVNIIITINMGDSYFRPLKKNVPDESSKKKKKKNKTITITSEQQLSELTNQRIAELKDYMRSNNIPEKLATFEIIKTGKAAPPTSVKEKPSKKKYKKVKPEVNEASKTQNVIVTVGKIMNL